MDVFEYSRESDFTLNSEKYERLKKLVGRGLMMEEISKKSSKIKSVLGGY